MEQPNRMKTNNEQFPLLKVENGLETATRQPSPTVRRELKRVLVDSWPNFLSGYWTMIAVLMTLGLMVYSITMGWYTKSALLLSDYHFYEPIAMDRIFFYHLVPIGFPPMFAIYSEFLDAMAYQHPSLELNICFLIDDSVIRLTDMWPRPYTHNPKYNSRNKRDWQIFEIKHDNVKISFMRLSNFMIKTPLRYYWRTVPLSYLPSYARMFSVWKEGGIGMDLVAYNNRFSKDAHLDRRVRTILKNHNDHSEINYNVLLKAIDDEEENCLLNLSARIFNETASLFNKLIPIAMVQEMKTLLLPLLNASPIANVMTKYILDTANGTDTNENTTTDIKSSSITDDKLDIPVNTLPLEMTNEDNITRGASHVTLDQSKQISGGEEGALKINDTVSMNKSNGADFESPRIVLLYDLSLVADNKDQSKLPAMAFSSEDSTLRRKDVARLAINCDGTFVAATQKKHHFLEMLLKDRLHKLRPDYAIQDTFMTECSDVFKYEDYCNIYHL